MTTEELLNKATAATRDLKFDGRSKPELTERTLRYYLLLRYLTPPILRNGRRAWTEEHLRELIDIRRAVSAGTPLKEVGESRRRETETPWRLANRGAMRSQLIDVNQMRRDFELVKSQLSVQQSRAGWSLRLSPDITLSGFTALQPTPDEIRNVITALSRIIPE